MGDSELKETEGGKPGERTERAAAVRVEAGGRTSGKVSLGWRLQSFS